MTAQRAWVWRAALVGSSVALITILGVGHAASQPGLSEPTGRPRAQTSSAPPATPMRGAEELLRQMTVEEKVMQLSAVYPMALLGREGPIKRQLDAQLNHMVECPRIMSTDVTGVFCKI